MLIYIIIGGSFAVHAMLVMPLSAAKFDRNVVFQESPLKKLSSTACPLASAPPPTNMLTQQK